MIFTPKNGRGRMQSLYQVVPVPEAILLAYLADKITI